MEMFKSYFRRAVRCARNDGVRSYLFFIVCFWVSCSLATFQVQASTDHSPSFNVIALGVGGGVDEGNLSSYLLAPGNSKSFILLDAGTLINGLKKPSTQESLRRLGIYENSPLKVIDKMMNSYIKAYLISHAHLDHIAGMVIGSTEDAKKNIFGRETTLQYLRDYMFNWKIWPNFADQGVKPHLNKYHYTRLSFNQFVKIPGTTLRVAAFPLSHGNGYPSTAFLIRSEQDAYILYLGDTGADVIEHSHDLSQLWHTVAPLIATHKLKAIFIESSYPNTQPDQQLWGHLKPKYLLAELRELARLVNAKHPQSALKNLKILVTHIKTSLKQENTREEIKEELEKHNDLGVQFIFIRQGQLLKL